MDGGLDGDAATDEIGWSIEDEGVDIQVVGGGALQRHKCVV